MHDYSSKIPYYKLDRGIYYANSSFISVATEYIGKPLVWSWIALRVKVAGNSILLYIPLISLGFRNQTLTSACGSGDLRLIPYLV